MNVILCQLLPYEVTGYRRTYRRASFLLARILADMGVAGATPLLARFGSPILPDNPEKR